MVSGPVHAVGISPASVDTLDGLAQKLGLPGTELSEPVERFNAARRDGTSHPTELDGLATKGCRHPKPTGRGRFRSRPPMATNCAPNAWGGEMAFVALLFAVSASDLFLYAATGRAAVAWLLPLHLGTVLAFFVLTPFSKMAHGFYQLAALMNVRPISTSSTRPSPTVSYNSLMRQMSSKLDRFDQTGKVGAPAIGPRPGG